jgi:hypothetical protein
MSLGPSKRQKQAPAESAGSYRYEEIPESLRVQILHILDAALGDASQFHSKRGPQGPRQAYALVVETLCTQYQLPTLVGMRDRGARDHRSELWEFLLGEPDIDRVLDAVELSFRCVDHLARRFDYLKRTNADEIATAAIAELNGRFREHRIGYAYQSGEIVRIA